MGPRPEAPEIVRGHYTPDDLTTLKIAPGVTSRARSITTPTLKKSLPGSCSRSLRQVALPAKLAIDRVYIERARLCTIFA